MNRDMELVRMLLIKIGDDPRFNGRSLYQVYAPDFETEGFSHGDIDYHLSLLIEAGLVNGERMLSPSFVLKGLSWQGHEFLDDTRDPDIWQTTRDRAQKVAGVGLGLAWEIAKAEIKVKLGLP